MKARLTTLDMVFATGILAACLIIIIVFFNSVESFRWLIREDSLLENLTALGLFAASLTLVIRLVRRGKSKSWFWKLGLGLMALAFFFGAGEEISWGQRIFEIESSEYFKANNAQGETNLHNIKIGEVKLNKLIFSNLLSVAFGVYFLVLPIIYEKNKWARSLINKFGIVLPKQIQVLVFLFCTVGILGLVINAFLPTIPSGLEEMAVDNVKRKWEAWEFIFGCTIFWICLAPKPTIAS